MKVIRWILYLLGALVLLIALAAILVPLLFDINDYKPRIENAVAERTGRALSIEGDLALTVFPWLGVDTGRLVVANPPGFGAEPFLAVESAAVRVKLVPLVLSREFEVDTIELEEPRLHLIRKTDGSTNWEDLAGESGDGEAAAGGAAALTIGGVQIEGGVVVLEDRAAGTTTTVDAIELESSAIVFGQPSDVQLALHYADSASGMNARVGLETAVTVLAARKQLTADDLKLTVDGSAGALSFDARVKGRVEVDGNTGAVTAPGLELSGSARMPGTDVEFTGTTDVSTTSEGIIQADPLSLTARGKVAGMPLEARAGGQVTVREGSQALVLNTVEVQTAYAGVPLTLSTPLRLFMKPDSQSFNADDLRIQFGNASAVGKASGQLLGDRRIGTELTVDPFNLRELLTRMGVELETSDPEVLKTASGTVTLNLKPDSAMLVIDRVAVDETTLTGRVNVSAFIGPAATVQLEADTIDLDRYLPPTSEEDAVAASPGAAAAAGAAQIPVDTLRTLALDGSIRLGSVKVAKLTATNMRFDLAAADGVLTITPQANFYGGRYQGEMRLDVTGNEPRFSANERLTGVQAEPLTRDMLGKARLAGTGNLGFNVNGNAEEPVDSASGTVNFNFRDGAILGVNIAHLLRRGKAMFEGRRLGEDERGQQKTDFSELTLTSNIVDGALRGNMNLKSPLLRVDGEGSIGLVNRQIDAVVTAVLVNTLQGQGGSELVELEGIPIPIRITGTTAQPAWAIDFESLLAGKAKETLQRELLKLLQPKEEKQDKGAEERPRRRDDSGG